MRIAFIWDWENDHEQTMTWHDGLAAAVRVLSQRHELAFFTCGSVETTLPHPYFPIHVKRSGKSMQESVAGFDPNVILMWGDTTRPNAAPLAELGKPMALCFAGGHQFGDTVHFFDHFFVESEVYKQKYELAGLSVSTAFGTNTEFFQPIPEQRKNFDVIFPATYASWKRHNLFAEATKGLRACTVGYMYDDHEQWCWEEPMRSGALTLPHASADVLRHLYAASKVCLITSEASGGSQRTVLEAMSMNIPVIVMSDSDKCSEYVRDAESMGMWAGTVANPNEQNIRTALQNVLEPPRSHPMDRGPTWNGRDYVLSKWSEHHYADALEEGLKKICKV